MPTYGKISSHFVPYFPNRLNSARFVDSDLLGLVSVAKQTRYGKTKVNILKQETRINLLVITVNYTCMFTDRLGSKDPSEILDYCKTLAR